MPVLHVEVESSEEASRNDSFASSVLCLGSCKSGGLAMLTHKPRVDFPKQFRGDVEKRHTKENR